MRNGEKEKEDTIVSLFVQYLSFPCSGSLSRTLVSIRLAAGCSIFDANAKPSEKVNANAKLDTRRARRRQKFEEQQIPGTVKPLANFACKMRNRGVIGKWRDNLRYSSRSFFDRFCHVVISIGKLIFTYIFR